MGLVGPRGGGGGPSLVVLDRTDEVSGPAVELTVPQVTWSTRYLGRADFRLRWTVLRLGRPDLKLRRPVLIKRRRVIKLRKMVLNLDLRELLLEERVRYGVRSCLWRHPCILRVS